MTQKYPPDGNTHDLFLAQNNLIRELSSISDLSVALERIMDVVIEYNDASAVALYLHDDDTNEMRLQCHRGLSEQFVTAHQKNGIGSRGYQDLQGITPIQEQIKLELEKEGIFSAAIFPIFHQDRPLAAICVGAERAELPPADIRSSVETICMHLGGILSRLKIEAALRDYQRRLQSLFNNVPVPAYTWRLAGDDFELVDANPYARKFTQGGVDQIMRIKAADYFVDRPDIHQSLWECYREQLSFQLTYPFQFKYMEAKKYLRVTFTYSEPDQVTAYTEDITSERNALDELKLTNQQLWAEQKALEEKNIALQQVLQAIREEKNETGQEIQTNLESRIMPLLQRLEEGAGKIEKKYIQSIRKGLAEITSPFVNILLHRYRNLSQRELEICGYIVQGDTTKQIAQTLNVAEETVRTQRKSIRKKLGIKSSKVNLQTHLMAFLTDTPSEA